MVCLARWPFSHKQHERLKQCRYLEHYLCPEVVRKRWRRLGLLVETALNGHKANVFRQAHDRWEVRGVKDVSWFEVHLSHRKDRLIIQGAFASDDVLRNVRGNHTKTIRSHLRDYIDL